MKRDPAPAIALCTRGRIEMNTQSPVHETIQPLARALRQRYNSHSPNHQSRTGPEPHVRAFLQPDFREAQA